MVVYATEQKSKSANYSYTWIFSIINKISKVYPVILQSKQILANSPLQNNTSVFI